MPQESILSSLHFFRPHGKKHGCKEETIANKWADVRCGQREWENLYRRGCPREA